MIIGAIRKMFAINKSNNFIFIFVAEVKDLKLENQKLYERIDEMRNDQRALEEQVTIII